MWKTRESEAMEQLFGQTRNDTRGNNKTNKLRGGSRISSLSGRLQSIHGRNPDGSTCRLLVDSAAAINFIKKYFLKRDQKTFKFIKKFAMGDEKHQTTEATYLSYFGKNHLFHIVDKEFPLPEDGIIGLPFFHKFPRYAITQKFLVIDKWKLPLYCDGEYIPKNSANICQIKLNNEDDQVLWIENRKEIPDGLYAIKNNKLEIPLHKYDNIPLRVPEHINLKRITSIKTRDVVSKQKSG